MYVLVILRREDLYFQWCPRRLPVNGEMEQADLAVGGAK